MEELSRVLVALDALIRQAGVGKVKIDQSLNSAFQSLLPLNYA
jgi:hypothetical protein